MCVCVCAISFKTVNRLKKNYTNEVLNERLINIYKHI